MTGSKKGYCDSDGQCHCSDGFTGKNCEKCTDDTQVHPNCYGEIFRIHILVSCDPNKRVVYSMCSITK